MPSETKLIGYPEGEIRLSPQEMLDLIHDRSGWGRMWYILPPGTLAEIFKKEQAGELSSTAAKQVIGIIIEHNNKVLLDAALDTLRKLGAA